MSLWDASLETANAVYITSSIVLIISAALTLLATGAAFWSSALKDKYADQRALVLESSYENAKVEQLRIQESNLRLQTDLERERKARLEIEGRLASRRVSIEQCASIREFLNHSGMRPQTLVITQEEEESTNYASQIVGCLQSAGVPTRLQRNGIMIGVTPGLTIQLPDNPSSKKIREAIEGAGIEANYLSIGGSSIVVVVGPKPQKF